MLKVTRPRFRPRFPSRSFAPGLLFGSGIQGVWYDPSDFSTMFQDVAGTTPVTAVGQSVALIRDKSGNGNHATQSVLASMPTLNVDAGGRYFLLFDGSNDSMLTNNIDFTGTNRVTLCAGIRKLSDASGGRVVELSANGETNNGAFSIWAPSTGGAASLAYVCRGTTTRYIEYTNAAIAAPVTLVATGQSNISAPSASLRVNGAQVASSALTQGTGNYGNYPLYIGRRGGTTAPFNGRLYSLVVRGSASTPSEIVNMESWVNGKTGAY